MDAAVDSPEPLLAQATPGGVAPQSSPFRYSYPVRESGSDQLYTEERQRAAAQSSSGGGGQVASATTGDAPTKSRRPRPAPTPSAAEAADDAAEGVSGPGEFTASDTSGADIGEGRFERSRFRYSLGVYEGFDTNVYLTQNDEVASLYTMIAAGIGYSFGSSRLKLDASLSAGLTFYYEGFDAQDSLFPTVQLNLAATYAATPRMSLSFSTLTAYMSQPNYVIPGAPVGNDGDYIVSSSSFGVNYLWLPKFATETTYSPVFYVFTDPYWQDQQGRIEQTLGQQFIYLWKPTTSLVAEYRANTRNYFVADDLDSFGNIVLLGANHTFNPRSTMSVRGGVEQRINQNPDGGGDDFYLGPFGELNFNYAIGARTVVGLGARYGTQASGLANINQTQQFQLNFNLAHQLTSRISADVFFNYQNNYYDQPGIIPDYSTNVYDVGFNLNYRINRAWTLTAGYRYSGLLSGDDFSQNSYNRNIVFVGTEVDF